MENIIKTFNKIYPIILCGGSGERLWPLSRDNFPKQFCKLLGNETLFQSTIKRFHNNEFQSPTILSSHKYKNIILDQLLSISVDPYSIILEPMSKNTAPAILAAALLINAKNPNSIILITPSDQVFNNIIKLQSTITEEIKSADDGKFILFGIKPTRPEIGYGYVEFSRTYLSDDSTLLPVKSFIEKPNLTIAKKMFIAKNYLWNSGIILCSTSSIINIYKTLVPQIYNIVLNTVKNAKEKKGFIFLPIKPWNKCPKISIDYLILEKINDLFVKPIENNWSDLGSWEYIWNYRNPDKLGNVKTKNSYLIDSKNSFIYSENNSQKIVGVGLHDILAVVTHDSILITKKSQSQKISNRLLNLNKINSINFNFSIRRWGSIKTICNSDKLLIKEILLHPLNFIHLINLNHTQEHWIVKQGSVKLIIDNKTFKYSTYESFSITKNQKFKIINLIKNNVLLIKTTIIQ